MDTTMMTADEYRALREGLGLTQSSLAYRLGVSLRTVSARERGEVAIDSEAATAIRALARDNGTPEPPEAA